MKTDSLFYRLFQEQPGLVFELAGWPLPAGAVYTLRAEEVKQTSFRLDGVLVPPPQPPGLPVVFVDAQFQGDPDFFTLVVLRNCFCFSTGSGGGGRGDWW